jgi:prepilin-type N-terminal cleavage/methylation domain-containing protein
MKTFTYKNHNGFSLLEALIGITIGAIVFTIFIQSVLSANTYIRLQDFQSRAVLLTQQYMEDVMQESYSSLEPSREITFSEESDPIPNGNTVVTINVTDIDDPNFGTAAVDYKQVKVQVSWDNNVPQYTGRESYTLSCFYTPNSGSVLTD